MLVDELSFVLVAPPHRPFTDYPTLAEHRANRLRIHVFAAVAALAVAAAVLWLVISVWSAGTFLPDAARTGPRGLALRACFAVVLYLLWSSRSRWLQEHLTIAWLGESRLDWQWTWLKRLSMLVFAAVLALPLKRLVAPAWEHNTFDVDWGAIGHGLLALEIPALVFGAISAAAFGWVEAVHRRLERQERADGDPEHEPGTAPAATD
uniref:hypothetical protein n=1 Tax=Amycolatopsis sp. CA-096443 TaxID=3239919 RepID=UPI003F495AFF